MRVDTTVVESNIHYPTDSTLLGDGVRVLTRTMRKITDIVGMAGTKLRNRSRSVKLRVLEIMRIARAKGSLNRERLQQRYRRLLDTTSRVVGQAKRFSEEISDGIKRSADVFQQIALQGLRAQLDQKAAMTSTSRKSGSNAPYRPRPKSAHYRSGTRKIVASGGTTRLTSGTAPSSNLVTAPAFPTLLPPYSAESLLRISRQVPENGTLMR